MSQQSVMTFLKKNKGKWFDNNQLRKALKISASSISTTTKILRRARDVEFKVADSKLHYFHRVRK